MDFIIKLPKFKESIMRIKYNLILLIINRLIKWGYFISFLKEIGAKETTYIFYKNIIINHEILEKMIINKDIKFKFKF